MQPEYTLEDLLISRIAKEMNGEMVAGAATYCSLTAVKLAQALYNPDLIDFSSGLHHFDSRTSATMVRALSDCHFSAALRILSRSHALITGVLLSSASISFPG